MSGPMDEQEHERLAHFEEWYWWHRGRQAIVGRILSHYASASTRVLDVGCGTGATTLRLQRFGPVVGLDIGRRALEVARGRGLSVAQASATHLPVRPGAFDLVVALDVLEHLDDDVGAARQMRTALRPGGLLLATVPAYPFLWSGHDEALGHRRRYRRGPLLAALGHAGFEIVFCSYVMGSILPAAMIVRLYERWVRRGPARRESGYVLVPAPLNALLAWITSAGGLLLPWFRLPFGLSLAVVARRPALPVASGRPHGEVAPQRR
jgi:SAM-dependent methyltransferase